VQGGSKGGKEKTCHERWGTWTSITKRKTEKGQKIRRETTQGKEVLEKKQSTITSVQKKRTRRGGRDQQKRKGDGGKRRHASRELGGRRASYPPNSQNLGKKGDEFCIQKGRIAQPSRQSRGEKMGRRRGGGVKEVQPNRKKKCGTRKKGGERHNVFGGTFLPLKVRRGQGKGADTTLRGSRTH